MLQLAVRETSTDVQAGIRGHIRPVSASDEGCSPDGRGLAGAATVLTVVFASSTGQDRRLAAMSMQPGQPLESGTTYFYFATVAVAAVIP